MKMVAAMLTILAAIATINLAATLAHHVELAGSWLFLLLYGLPTLALDTGAWAVWRAVRQRKARAQAG